MPEQSKVEELADKVKEYATIQYELIKLNAADKTSLFGADMAVWLILSMVAALVIIFISVAAGFYLSYLTGSNSTGFIIIGAFYLVAGIVLVIYRQKLIIKPVRDKIIKQIFSDEQ